MNTAVPPSPLPVRPAGTRARTRLRAVLCAVLFAPAVLAAGALSLTSERVSRCLTHGERCVTGVPDGLLGWSVGLAAVACGVALAAPRSRAGRAGLVVQVFAECAALLVLLSGAWVR